MRIGPHIISAIVLSSLLAAPALSNIIGVGVSGNVYGDAEVQFPCSNPFPFPFFCEDDSPFSNTSSQTGYGMYSLAGGAIDGLGVSGVNAQETAELTPSSFKLDLLTSAGYGGVVNTVVSDSASSTLTLSFELTEQSVLDLSGALTPQCFAFAPYFCSTGESIVLSGPGFDFSTFVNGAVDTSAILGPGAYTLTAFSNAGVSSVQLMSESTEEVSLDAKFTPMPEPRWAAVSLMPILLLVAVWRRWMRARHTA